MSAPLILWCVIALFANVPTAFSRPRHIGKPVSEVKVDEVQKRQSECGNVTNNELKSPRYPSNYPTNIHCVYWVVIPAGKTMNIYFNDFHLENHFSCGYDYLKIANEKDETFGGRNGKYCGFQYGSVSVTGQYAVLTFHSDSVVASRGYNLTFTLIPTGSMFPSAGPSPDAKSELQYLIAIVRYLLNQMEYVVNNEVFSVSVRDYEARVKRAITDVHHALRAEGRQKRDVSSVKMISQLEKKADDLIKQLQIKEDRYQRSAPKRKVAIEDAEKAH